MQKIGITFLPILISFLFVWVFFSGKKKQTNNISPCIRFGTYMVILGMLRYFFVHTLFSK